jgi:The  BURPS668_1122 family of deaminases
MGNKIITEKDFWMCSSGAVPAQLQGTRKSNKKESGEIYITVADTATSSWIDFGCTKSMLFAALIAAVVAVVVVALIVGTGGIAAIGLVGMMAIGAGAGILGGVVAAVDGALKCGQKNATQRQWDGSKQNLILTGTPAITGDRTMTCKIGGVVKFAPEIKSWSQAIGLAGLNYLTKFAECGLAGMAVGGGGYMFAGLATGSLALAMPTVGSIASNVATSFTGIFGASRVLFGADSLANDAAMGKVDGAGDAFSSFGNGAIPEYGSIKRIATGNAQPADALLLLYLLHLKTPAPKENVAPKEEPTAKPKEEEVVKPTEAEPQANAKENNGKKGEAFEDGVGTKGINPEAGEVRANQIRERLGLKEGERNVAVADTNINGNVKSIEAVSGKNSPAGTVESPLDANRKFTTKKSGAMTRAYDTEVKILEDIAKDLPKDAKGTINLYTEKSPCFSCKGVIEQFKQQFPNIELNITTSNK